MISKILAVCGCLIKDDHVLLEWRGKDLDYKVMTDVWVLPGGKVEISDPSMEDAIIREWLEETGMKVTAKYEINRIFNKVVKYPNGKFYEVELHCFVLDAPQHDEYGEDVDTPLNFRWWELNTLETLEDLNGDGYAFIQECLDIELGNVHWDQTTLEFKTEKLRDELLELLKERDITPGEGTRKMLTAKIRKTQEEINRNVDELNRRIF